MNGIIKSARGEIITWTVNDKQVVVLKGKSLKWQSKAYSFIIRIDPPESGMLHPTTIVNLICHFPESTEFKEELCKFAENLWYNHLAKHPHLQLRIKRDMKVVTNKHKIDQLRTAIEKMSAQLEVCQAILKEIEL